MFFTIKGKTILISFLCVIVFACTLGFCFIRSTVSPVHTKTVVIDAGHGGRDGGSIGSNGTIEKEINLKYALCLKEILENKGIKVVLTRSDDNGLYDENADNKKLSDMSKRREIIKKAKPDVVVSIHMNSFANSSVSGARTFYQISNDNSKLLAKEIQMSLCNSIDTIKYGISPGDYYMLNCTDYTSVLIECGYISNFNEESLLNSDEYMKKFCYAVHCGILLFLGNFSYKV